MVSHRNKKISKKGKRTKPVKRYKRKSRMKGGGLTGRLRRMFRRGGQGQAQPAQPAQPYYFHNPDQQHNFSGADLIPASERTGPVGSRTTSTIKRKRIKRVKR